MRTVDCTLVSIAQENAALVTRETKSCKYSSNVKWKREIKETILSSFMLTGTIVGVILMGLFI